MLFIWQSLTEHPLCSAALATISIPPTMLSVARFIHIPHWGGMGRWQYRVENQESWWDSVEVGTFESKLGQTIARIIYILNPNPQKCDDLLKRILQLSAEFSGLFSVTGWPQLEHLSRWNEENANELCAVISPKDLNWAGRYVSVCAACCVSTLSARPVKFDSSIHVD